MFRDGENEISGQAIKYFTGEDRVIGLGPVRLYDGRNEIENGWARRIL